MARSDRHELGSQLKVGEPVKIIVHFHNTGKSPALNFRIVMESGPDGPPTQDQSKITFPKNDTCGKVKPDIGGPSVLPNERNTSPTTSHYELTNTALKGLLDGSLGLFVLGCFAYDDQFQRTHHIGFCEYISPIRHPTNPTTPPTSTISFIAPPAKTQTKATDTIMILTMLHRGVKYSIIAA